MNVNKHITKMNLGLDSRGPRGTLVRGNNIYGSGSFSSKTPNLQEIARKRLKDMNRRQLK